jgi:hypothetical protein
MSETRDEVPRSQTLRYPFSHFTGSGVHWGGGEHGGHCGENDPREAQGEQ